MVLVVLLKKQWCRGSEMVGKANEKTCAKIACSRRSNSGRRTQNMFSFTFSPLSIFFVHVPLSERLKQARAKNVPGLRRVPFPQIAHVLFTQSLSLSLPESLEQAKWIVRWTSNETFGDHKTRSPLFKERTALSIG